MSSRLVVEVSDNRTGSGKTGSQRPGCLEQDRTAHLADAEGIGEPVNQAGMASKRHGHAGLRQTVSVRLAFVSQDVEPGGRNMGGGQTREDLGEQWRRTRVSSRAFVGEIMAAEPVHVALGEVKAIEKQ